MAIADLHNDFLTACGGELPPEYAENKVVTAIFNDGRTFDEALRLADKSPLVAFEDVGYTDFDISGLLGKKPIYVGLTWNGENRFGYGCAFSKGLKPEGKALVKKLSESGIAVDTAHISKGGFSDITDIAECVVNSHTCFEGRFSHRRNIDDGQIAAIIEKGGIIGVTLCGYFMTDKKVCTADDLVSQIDYFCQKFSYRHLCIGSDFNGTDFLPEEIRNYGDFDILKEKLTGLGYEESAIDAILYGNLNLFLEKRNGRQQRI